MPGKLGKCWKCQGERGPKSECFSPKSPKKQKPLNSSINGGKIMCQDRQSSEPRPPASTTPAGLFDEPDEGNCLRDAEQEEKSVVACIDKKAESRRPD